MNKQQRGHQLWLKISEAVVRTLTKMQPSKHNIDRETLTPRMDNGRLNKWEDVNEETLFLTGPEDPPCDVNLMNFETSSLMCADCGMTP